MGFSFSSQNFLQGLLTKDPRQRLSWPDLLHHPFIAGRVTSESSPGLPGLHFLQSSSLLPVWMPHTSLLPSLDSFLLQLLPLLLFLCQNGPFPQGPRDTEVVPGQVDMVAAAPA